MTFLEKVEVVCAPLGFDADDSGPQIKIHLRQGSDIGAHVKHQVPRGNEFPEM